MVLGGEDGGGKGVAIRGRGGGRSMKRVARPGGGLIADREISLVSSSHKRRRGSVVLVLEPTAAERPN